MNFNFTYIFPDDFKQKLVTYSSQKCPKLTSEALMKCEFEYVDVGNAYEHGMKGDNWDKHAVDLEITCDTENLNIIRRQENQIKQLSEAAMKPSETGLTIRNFYYITDDNCQLAKTNEARLEQDISKAKSVLSDIIYIAEQLCNNTKYNPNTTENEVNDYIRDMLKANKKYEIRDQTRHGISQNNNSKEAGEVDILILKQDKEIALLEGLKLGSVNKRYINTHIEKATNSYNPLGSPVFIIIYSTAKDFKGFWERYLNYISEYSFENIPTMDNCTGLEELTPPNASIKIAHRIISKNSFKLPLYHIAINICR